jgi:hypothetical protein
MDSGEPMSLPFWFDDSDCLYYMPENCLVTLEDAYQKYGVTSNDVMQCKAWWNTNIPMGNFSPILTPCDTQSIGVNACLNNFIERVKQRTEGKMVPSPPELKLVAGIAILDKETLTVQSIYISHPDYDNKYTIKCLDITDNTVTGSWVTGEVIKRNPDYLYWNLVEGKYV